MQVTDATVKVKKNK